MSRQNIKKPRVPLKNWRDVSRQCHASCPPDVQRFVRRMPNGIGPDRPKGVSATHPMDMSAAAAAARMGAPAGDPAACFSGQGLSHRAAPPVAKPLSGCGTCRPSLPGGTIDDGGIVAARKANGSGRT